MGPCLPAERPSGSSNPVLSQRQALSRLIALYVLKYFTRPVRPGEIVTFKAKIAYAGRTSLVSYIEVFKGAEITPVMTGFITFVHVDSNTRPSAHNIEIHPTTEEDKLLYEQATNLKR
jgi:acyl-CoA hydrolase